MSTPNILFELLENAEYIKGNAVNLDRIQRATLTEIIDLGNESAELTSAKQIPRSQSAFAHSASLSLGGGRDPCGELECRIKNIEDLSQFAAFYSDKVYVHNILSTRTGLFHAKVKFEKFIFKLLPTAPNACLTV